MLQPKAAFYLKIEFWNGLLCKADGFLSLKMFKTDIAPLTHVNILGGINCLVEKRGWL